MSGGAILRKSARDTCWVASVSAVEDVGRVMASGIDVYENYWIKWEF